MRKSRTNRRTVKRQNRKQRGGKIVMPMRYFNDNFTGHYYPNPSSNQRYHHILKPTVTHVSPFWRVADP